MNTIQDILDAPDQSALAWVTPDGQEVRFEQLRNAACAFGGALAALNLPKSTQFLINTENPVTDFCLILATLGLGHNPIIAADIPTLQIAGVKIDHIIGLPDRNHTTLEFSQSWFEHEPTHLTETQARIIAGSSGTTGTQKFFSLNYDVFYNRAAIFRKIYAAHDITLSNRPHMITLGPAAIYAVLMAFGNLIDGRATLHPVGSPTEVPNLLAKYDAAQLSTTPLYLSEMLKADMPKLNLELIVSNGAKTHKALAQAAEDQLKAPTYSSYGSSEMGPGFFGRITELAQNGLGRVHPWIETTQRDGLIGIKGDPTLAATGYEHGTPILENGYFFPGDRIDIENGQAFWHGRGTDLINTGGDKIAPERIEDGLRNFPGITNVAAVALENDTDMDDIGLVIEASSNFSEAFLQTELKRQYGSRFQFRVAVVDDIPMAKSGKLVRRDFKGLFT